MLGHILVMVCTYEYLFICLSWANVHGSEMGPAVSNLYFRLHRQQYLLLLEGHTMNFRVSRRMYILAWISTRVFVQVEGLAFPTFVSLRGCLSPVILIKIYECVLVRSLQLVASLSLLTRCWWPDSNELLCLQISSKLTLSSFMVKWKENNDNPRWEESLSCQLGWIQGLVTVTWARWVRHT